MGICLNSRNNACLGEPRLAVDDSESSSCKYSGKDECGKSFVLSSDQLNYKVDPTHHYLKLFFEKNKKMIHSKIIKFYSNTLDLIPVTEVNFKSFTLSKPQPWYLRCILSYLPQLTKLNLCETRLGNSGLYEISKAFQFITSLNHLSIEQNFVNEVGFVNFSKNLRVLNKLEVLTVGNNRVGLQGVPSLVQAIEHFNELKEFYIHNNDVDVEIFRIIVKTLKNLKSLRLVGLEFNKLDKSCVPLIKDLCSSPTIKKLRLKCNLFEDDDIESLLCTLPAIDIEL